jgi:hypothetical protein
MDFTNDEMNLMCIYPTGSRSGLIAALEKMRSYLQADDTDLRALADGTLAKLNRLSDAEFETLELFPDFYEEL